MGFDDQPMMFLAHRGENFFADLKYSNYSINSAFDVGAHYGETIADIHRSFKNATITSFEPCPEFVERLLKDCKGIISTLGENFCLETVACSSLAGTSLFAKQGAGSHLVERLGQGKPEQQNSNQSLGVVKTIRLDQYIESKGYHSIDLLKIDVEGHEMKVLEGIGEELLTKGFFSMIYLEAGVSTDNIHHTPFLEVVSYLHKYGYEVFGFYEQVNEFLTSQTHLRRTNIGFVHKSSIHVLPSNFNG